TSLASAQGAAESFISAARRISDCQIALYSVTYRTRADSVIEPRSALFASPIAEFVFELSSDATLHYVQDTPLNSAWLLTSGPDAGVGIDLTNTDVISLTDAFTSGPWVDPFNLDIGPVDVAYKKDIT